MGYQNWFRDYFKEKHQNSTHDEILDDVFLMLESRSKEYLQHNYESYKELYINPVDDIVNSKPQIIQQVKEELRDYLKLLLENNVKNVLQIGLGHFGSTQFCLNLICDNVVTVEFDIKNISNYANRELLYNQNVEKFIYGSSVDNTIIDQVRSYVELNGEFDCLFIDGNHSYEYVKLDHDNYSPFVKDFGIVSFHDAFLDAERYGTPRVLKEIGMGASDSIKYIKHSNEVGFAYYLK